MAVDRKSAALLVAAALLLSALVKADSLPIQPGKWQARITSKLLPYAPQPQTQTRVQCVRDPHFDPALMLTNYGGFNCRINRAARAGDTLTWRLDCSSAVMPQMSYSGVGAFTAESAVKGHGSMQINMSMPGLGAGIMQFDAVATRLGSCG